MCEDHKTKQGKVCSGDSLTEAVEGKADLSSGVSPLCCIPAILMEG